MPQTEAQRLWYQRNKPKALAVAAAAKRRTVEKLHKLKDHPCMDCGLRYPYYVMDWDHVRGVKLFNASSYSASKYGLKKMLAEIEKCELVCSNCHRERTHQRRESQASKDVQVV